MLISYLHKNMKNIYNFNIFIIITYESGIYFYFYMFIRILCKEYLHFLYFYNFNIYIFYKYIILLFDSLLYFIYIFII